MSQQLIDERGAGPDRTAAAPGHLDALDGVRAVAIVLVVLLHVADATAMASDGSRLWRVVANGGVGVPVFFVLSGLLLYRPWAKEAIAGGVRPAVPGYLWRRALRVLPAYWILAVAALFAFSREHVGSPLTWVKWLTLTTHYDPDPWWDGLGPPGLVPMWSLSVEVAFYALLPLLAAGLRRFAHLGRGWTDPDLRARRLLLALGVLTAGSWLLSMVLRLTLDFEPFFYFQRLLPRSLLYFTLGMALTVVAVWARARPDSRVAWRASVLGGMPGVWWLVAGCALVLAATPIATPEQGLPQNGFQFIVSGTLYPVIAVAVVLPAALVPTGPTTLRVLGNPAVRGLGLISFGVFLWHMVAIDGWYEITGRPLWQHDFWVVFPIVAVASVAAATVSYFGVEKPAQRFRDRGPGRRRAPGAM